VPNWVAGQNVSSTSFNLTFTFSQTGVWAISVKNPDGVYSSPFTFAVN
jgi:hypothetical protein